MKKKIKLRDMTPEQYNDYLNNRCVGGDNCRNCIFAIVNCQDPECNDSWINNKDFYGKKFLDQEVEIEVPDILDEKEKEYLSNIIKPFGNRVIDIKKVGYCGTGFIAIGVVNAIDNFTRECINLPSFKQNTMYKGMKENYSYTVKDLGL